MATHHDSVYNTLLALISEHDDDSGSGSDSDLSELKPRPKLYQKLPMRGDTYCYLMVAAACAECPTLHDGSSKALKIGMLITAITMHLFGAVMETGIPVLLQVFCINKSMKHYEIDYALATAAIKEALAASPPHEIGNATEAERDARRLCASDTTAPVSQSLMIFIWAMRMLPHIVWSFWFMRVTIILPTAAPGTNLVEPDGADKLAICRTTRRLRLFILFFVNLPRVVTSLVIGFIGAEFLIYASDMGTLIIKSLALFFITTISDIVFSALGSANIQRVITGSCFKHEVSTQRGIATNWHLWLASLTKFAVLIILTLLFTRVWHGPMQRFRDWCGRYEVHFPFIEE